MEPFVDFGMIELLAAAGVIWLARRVYARRDTGIAFIIASIAAPAFLVILPHAMNSRWLAALCLATAVVNAGAQVAVLRERGTVRRAPL